MEQLSPPRDDQTIDYGVVYQLFCEAEIIGTELTVKYIREHIFPRSESNVRLYIYRYWSWFLHRHGKKGQAHTYRCKGLDGYPPEHFITAHRLDQMQYFYHFAIAIQRHNEHVAEVRAKRVQTQAEQLELSIVDTELPDAMQASPPVLTIEAPSDEQEEEERETEETTQSEVRPGAGSALPQAMHFMESPTTDHAHVAPPGNEAPEPPDSANEEVTRQDPDTGSSPLLTDPSLAQTSSAFFETTSSTERTTSEMRPLFGRNMQREEAMNQLRSEFANRIQALEQALGEKQDQLRTELLAGTQAMEQKLIEELHQVCIPPDLSPLQEDVVSSMRTVEQTVVRERGQLSTELAKSMQTVEQKLAVRLQQMSATFDLSSLRTDMISNVKSAEQAVVTKQDQLHAESGTNMRLLEQRLTAHLQQMGAMFDISPLQTTFASRMNDLEQGVRRELHQLQLPEELSQVSEALDRLRQHISALSLASQSALILENLTRLQDQHNRLSSSLSHLSPTTPSGQQKLIRKRAQALVSTALEVIRALEVANADWLDEHLNMLAEIQDRSLAAMVHADPPEGGEEQSDHASPV